MRRAVDMRRLEQLLRHGLEIGGQDEDRQRHAEGDIGQDERQARPDQAIGLHRDELGNEHHRDRHDEAEQDDVEQAALAGKLDHRESIGGEHGDGQRAEHGAGATMALFIIRVGTGTT